MNTKEIYVLNRALDGADIPFMPTSEQLGITDFLADAVKDGLIQRGYLENPATFTTEGVRVTERLRRYKAAKRHVKIDNLLVGVEDEKESIVLLWNPLFEEYAIHVINSATGAQQIVESYSFLQQEAQAPDEGEKKLTYNEFAEQIQPERGASFTLSTRQGGAVTEEVYCKAKGKLYIYNRLAHTLHAKSLQDMVACLEERVGMA